jgi:hypothetical protein
MKQKILASFLRSMKKLLMIKEPEGSLRNKTEQIAKAMISVSLSSLSSQTANDEINNASLDLLRTCLEKGAVNEIEISCLAEEAARSESYKAWEILILHLEDGSNILKSLHHLKVSLQDYADGSRQRDALDSISYVTQHISTPGEKCKIIPFIVEGVGAQIIQLLRVYGQNQKSNDTRMTTCATCVKIMMLIFQQLHSSNSAPNVGTEAEMESGAFLAIVFEALVSIVLYNGLPNQNSSKNSGSDPLIGKLCAQTFVHIVRTAPTIFRTSVGFLSVEDRGVLELAVRTDMNGYAPPAREKKKLSLKGFRKL